MTQREAVPAARHAVALGLLAAAALIPPVLGWVWPGSSWAVRSVAGWSLGLGLLVMALGLGLWMEWARWQAVQRPPWLPLLVVLLALAAAQLALGLTRTVLWTHWPAPLHDGSGHLGVAAGHAVWRGAVWMGAAGLAVWGSWRLWLYRTPQGLVMRALLQDPQRMALLGFRSHHFSWMAGALGLMLLGVGALGVNLSQLRLQPSADTTASLAVLALLLAVGWGPWGSARQGTAALLLGLMHIGAQGWLPAPAQGWAIVVAAGGWLAGRAWHASPLWPAPVWSAAPWATSRLSHARAEPPAVRAAIAAVWLGLLCVPLLGQPQALAWGALALVWAVLASASQLVPSRISATLCAAPLFFYVGLKAAAAAAPLHGASGIGWAWAAAACAAAALVGWALAAAAARLQPLSLAALGVAGVATVSLHPSLMRWAGLGTDGEAAWAWAGPLPACDASGYARLWAVAGVASLGLGFLSRSTAARVLQAALQSPARVAAIGYSANTYQAAAGAWVAATATAVGWVAGGCAPAAVWASTPLALLVQVLGVAACAGAGRIGRTVISAVTLLGLYAGWMAWIAR